MAGTDDPTTPAAEPPPAAATPAPDAAPPDPAAAELARLRALARDVARLDAVAFDTSLSGMLIATCRLCAARAAYYVTVRAATQEMRDKLRAELTHKETCVWDRARREGGP